MALTEQVFEELFMAQYDGLYRYAFGIVHREVFTAELVSDAFHQLWERKDRVAAGDALAGYLYTTVHHNWKFYL